MKEIRRDVIRKSLIDKGFREKECKHHDKYCFYLNGKWYPQIYANLSRGSAYKTYDENLLKLMKKALRLEGLQDVKDLLACPMKKEQYLKILKDKEQLP